MPGIWSRLSSVVFRPEGGLRRTVVLRVASATPWHVVGWTLEVLRPDEDDCPVHLYVTGRVEA